MINYYTINYYYNIIECYLSIIKFIFHNTIFVLIRIINKYILIAEVIMMLLIVLVRLTRHSKSARS